MWFNPDINEISDDIINNNILRIRNLFKYPKNKELFLKKIWLSKVNEDKYMDYLSKLKFKKKQELLERLETILHNLKKLNGYSLELEFKKNLNKLVRKNYQLQLEKLEKNIVENNYDINYLQTLKYNLIKSIPYTKTNEIETDITFDKTWTTLFSEDIDIKFYNFVNAWFNFQIFVFEKDKKKEVMIKFWRKIYAYNDISNFEYNVNEKEGIFIISFEQKDKKIIYFGVWKKYFKTNKTEDKEKKTKIKIKEWFYKIIIPIEYIEDHLTIKEKIKLKFFLSDLSDNLEEALKIDIKLWKDYLNLIRQSLENDYIIKHLKKEVDIAHQKSNSDKK